MSRLRLSSNKPSFINFSFKISKDFLRLPSPLGMIFSIVRLNFPQFVSFGFVCTTTFIPSSSGNRICQIVIKQPRIESLSFKSKKTNLFWFTLKLEISPSIRTLGKLFSKISLLVAIKSETL